jgi:hypothetical protein
MKRAIKAIAATAAIVSIAIAVVWHQARNTRNKRDAAVAGEVRRAAKSIVGGKSLSRPVGVIAILSAKGFASYKRMAIL